MPAHFTEAAIKFLRGLKRNNDRAWFDTRKRTYETELKEPLLAVIEEINRRLVNFAPEFVRPAPKVAMRIYRDVRFSKNKDPYKTNIAAWWARAGMEKTSGGGFYLQITADEVMVAAGVYMPDREQTLAIRRHLLERHADYQALIGARKLRALFAPFDGMKLTRAPKGFAPDHPAAELIMQRQWGISSTLPGEIALEPNLVAEVVKRLKVAAPLVELLNEPLMKTITPKPLF